MTGVSTGRKIGSRHKPAAMRAETSRIRSAQGPRADRKFLYGNSMLRPLRLAYGLALLIDLLERHGHRIDPLLTKTGIPRFAIDEPSYRIRFEQELGFISSALKVLKLPTVGLELGRQYTAAFLGVLGLAACSAPTIREMFRALPSYPELCWVSVEYAVWREGDDEFIVFKPTAKVRECAAFFVERDAAAILSLIRQNLGEHVTPISISFAHAAPCHPAPYERFFRCPVRFGTAVSELRISQTVWDSAPLQANPMAYRFFSNQCRSLVELIDSPLSYADVVRARLRTAMPLPSFPDVVKSLHLSARSLQRHLQDEGTDFSSLRDEIRQERATEFITHGGVCNSEIAQRLGFEDATAFSRAFKRWTGSSPQAFRKKFLSNE